MLSRLSSSAAALLLFAALVPAQAAAPSNNAIDQQVEAARVQQAVPGLALLVMKNGKIEPLAIIKGGASVKYEDFIKSAAATPACDNAGSARSSLVLKR